MKGRVHLSAWTSSQAEQRFREMEDELVRQRLATAPEAIDIDTHLGSTRAYRWEGAGEPVVHLHGTAGTALMWAPYTDRRGGRAMYAIDTIGDVGRSRQQVAVTDAEDLAGWLSETLCGLGLERVHLVGTSYGGFLALNQAARRPETVRSLFLVDPAGIERVRLLRFMGWGLSTLAASWLPTPSRRAAAKRLRVPALEDPAVFRVVLYGQRHHRTRLLRPGPLTDDQLRALDMPAHFLLGAKSEVFPSSRVRDRVEALVPHATVEAVADAGHAVATSHTDLVAHHLNAFLNHCQAGPPAADECPPTGLP